MARLPYVDPATAPKPVQEALAGLPIALKIFRMMAHAETNFRPLLRLGSSILAQQHLSAQLRELAILRIATLSQARYEWVQHVPIAKAVGVSDAQIAALHNGDLTAGCFDARERLLLRFTDELVRDVRVSDETFESMAREFPPRDIVELILAVGFYMLIARLLETTAVDMDEAAGMAIVGQPQSPTPASPRAAAITVKALDHFVLRVRDLDASLRFYRDLLGLPIRFLDEYRAGERPFVSVSVGAQLIDVVPDATYKPDEARQASGFLHFCVGVEAGTLSGIIPLLKERGVPLLEEQPVQRMGATGIGLSIYVADPDGYIVELKEQPS